MKKITISSTTSMSEVMLSSGSSGLRGLRSIARDPGVGPPAARLLLFQQLDELHRFLLHLHHEPLDPATQVAIADQRRNGDEQSRRRRNERFGDAAGEDARIAARLSA